MKIGMRKYEGFVTITAGTLIRQMRLASLTSKYIRILYLDLDPVI